MSCPDCFRGAVLEGEPTGAIRSDYEGAYFASGSGETSTRAIILLTDAFGLPLKNSKILADSYAQHLACDVWVPDFFAGPPPVTEEQMKTMPDRAGVKMSFLDILKFIWAALPSVPALIRNRPSVVDARTISFVKKLQENKKYEKLGAIGYCLGGGIALRVGASTGLFNSIVLVHASPPFNDDHIKTIKAPTAWACAESDMSLKPARLEQIEALYEARKGKDTFVDYEIKVYKGTAHGFGARPNFAYPEVKEGFEKAFEQGVVWFNKTIPA
ncbi:Alpha/Beta hydrolase protein [Mycena crocata]|nr:Alpha/Beta hydrolase protein [Mycena crocata]